VPAGQVVHDPGRPSEVLFIVKSGRFRLYRVAADGRTVTTALPGPAPSPAIERGPTGRTRVSRSQAVPRSVSSSRSHTSLRVGKAGTACQSVSSGTSPTIAMVAACSSSPAPGPTNVAPTITRRA
jgi:hypothetical protein